LPIRRPQRLSLFNKLNDEKVRKKFLPLSEQNQEKVRKKFWPLHFGGLGGAAGARSKARQTLVIVNNKPNILSHVGQNSYTSLIEYVGQKSQTQPTVWDNYFDRYILDLSLNSSLFLKYLIFSSGGGHEREISNAGR
jgi:hypothetical protein